MAIKHVKVVCDTAFPDCACKEVGTSEWNDSHTIEAATSFCSPIFVTPALGVPASGVATNITGLPTAGILDNAVTLGKMAGITAGNLITGDACGDPAAIATGTCGQVLTSNGACTAPTFQAAAGGGCSPTTVAIKSGTTSRVNACFSDDPDLTFCLSSCSKYFFILKFKTFEANACATPGIKFKFTVPTGATGKIMGPAKLWRTESCVSNLCLTTQHDYFPGHTICSAWDNMYEGFVETGGCTGTFAVSWAQINAAACTATSVAEGSSLVMFKG